MFVRAAAAAIALLPAALAYDNGFPAVPPMGWATWTTDDIDGLRDVCNAEEVLSVAQFLAESGMRDFGYTWMVLDDCWSDTSRNATGFLQPDPQRFPQGMKSLVQQVNDLGLKLGLYTCIGTETCRGGRPGSFGHYAEDAAVMAEWGVSLVKSDHCHKPGGFDDFTLYSNFSRHLNATGHPMYFAICSWGDDNVLEWGHEVAQMIRVQQDHLSFWSFPNWAAGKGYGQGVKEIIEYMGEIQPSKYGRLHGWLDPDFLETLAPVFLPPVASRTEFTFWAAWSAPLLVATDPRKMDSVKRSILMNPEVVAVNQDPLGVPADRRWRDNSTGVQIWSRPLANGDVAGILYNPQDFTPATIRVSWDQIGLPADGTVHVRDLWERRDLGRYGAEGLERVVGGHAAFFFRATPAK